MWLLHQFAGFSSSSSCRATRAVFYVSYFLGLMLEQRRPTLTNWLNDRLTISLHMHIYTYVYVYSLSSCLYLRILCIDDLSNSCVLVLSLSIYLCLFFCILFFVLRDELKLHCLTAKTVVTQLPARSVCPTESEWIFKLNFKKENIVKKIRGCGEKSTRCVSTVTLSRLKVRSFPRRLFA